MEAFKATLNDVTGWINGWLWHDYVLYTLVIVGVIFTIWSFFGQWRALTHGVAVVRGKYDEKGDPGAINHFQALSTALSATVGLGNIAGVAVAVNLGGPGAVFWMWVIGVVGMALKMTEVTQSMLYRNTSDPENPHGGPMFVAKYGFARWGLGGLGTAIGGLFVVTLLISAVTGGNMFQAWNVAAITENYFPANDFFLDMRLVVGIVLAIATGLVIIGGIKAIGRTASAIVPFMCVLYLGAAIYVLIREFDQIPHMLALIFRSGLPEWLGGSSADPERAFLGGTFGYAMLWGIKRALFSSESGQGSAPIAHSAAKTDEPVREGVVSGLEPFIDTIVVCTLTALVILSTGTFNREAEAQYAPGSVQVVEVDADGDGVQDTANGTPLWTLSTRPLPPKTPEARRTAGIAEGAQDWRVNETIFVIAAADENPDTGRTLRRFNGTVQPRTEAGWPVSWSTLASEVRPELPSADMGQVPGAIYGEYSGATLTGHAFDRVQPGLGKWMVTLACWLFAFSTIISWSYYGEQGIVYLFGYKQPVILLYKLIYCLFIVVACIPGLITTDVELDNLTALGTGVMLWVNIPLMLIFGRQAMTAYHDYFRRYNAGAMHDEIGRDTTGAEGPPPSGTNEPL